MLAAALGALLTRVGFVEPGQILEAYDAAARGWFGEPSPPMTLREGAGTVNPALWAPFWELLEDESKMAPGTFTTRVAGLGQYTDAGFPKRAGEASLAYPGVPDAEGTYPIDEAADVERLRMLLARGARFSAGRGGHALYRAAERGDVALVREQLAAGADANAVIEDGWSALHAAAAADHADVIEALLAAGANADSRNDRGETPLDVANQSRSQDAAHLLATRVRPGHP